MIARLPTAIASVLLLGSLAALLTVLSTADAYCLPPRPNNFLTYYHDGFIRNLGGTTVGGVYSYMSNYDPYVYPNAGFSTAWTAVTRTDHTRWAQIGWLKRSSNYRRTWIQYTYNDVAYTFEYSPEPYGSGQFSTYTTLYDPGVYPNPPTWTFQVNGITKLTVQSLGWTPNEGQINGETQSRASQMPGGSQDRQLFTFMHIYYAGSWNDFGGGGAATQPAYHAWTHNIPTVGEIWDKACSS